MPLCSPVTSIFENKKETFCPLIFSTYPKSSNCYYSFVKSYCRGILSLPQFADIDLVSFAVWQYLSLNFDLYIISVFTLWTQTCDLMLAFPKDKKNYHWHEGDFRSFKHLRECNKVINSNCKRGLCKHFWKRKRTMGISMWDPKGSTLKWTKTPL